MGDEGVKIKFLVTKSVAEEINKLVKEDYLEYEGDYLKITAKTVMLTKDRGRLGQKYNNYITKLLPSVAPI